MHFRLRTLLIVLAVGLPVLSVVLPPLLRRQPRGLIKLSVSTDKSDYPEVKRWIQIDSP